MARRKAWRKDRITAEVDPATDRRIVDLPTVTGMTAKQVSDVFEFERGILGTLRATIRIQKREHGVSLPIPHRLASAGIPKSLAKFYVEPDEADEAE